MAQLFRGRAENNPKSQLERELQLLEAQVKRASPGYETQFLNRAGNLCVDSGEPARALGYFGRAIDVYLESGRFSAAEVLCKKVLQIAPDAVRARCTLAWLSIGKGYHAGQQGPGREIAEYVRGAKQAGKEGLAVKQLAMMAEAAPSADLRELLAEHLLDLGEDTEADRLFGMVFAERNGVRPAPIEDEGKLWASLLRAALMGPQELKEQPVRGEDEGDHYLPALKKDD
ncbi:MAG: hypothetical protein KY464_13850 [Gemmatimonadetes bacterium]|nr:hypothetical protein [Gemmatimonadota bacterium]